MIMITIVTGPRTVEESLVSTSIVLLKLKTHHLTYIHVNDQGGLLNKKNKNKNLRQSGPRT